MTTTEKLAKIRARCVELLAIAEKRTRGKWCDKFACKSIFGDLHQVMHEDEHGVCWAINGLGADIFAHDAAYIAACAGPAEAGWRSTIAMIDLIYSESIPHRRETMSEQVAAQWPEELL